MLTPSYQTQELIRVHHHNIRHSPTSITPSLSTMTLAGHLFCTLVLLSSSEASWRNWIPSLGRCPDLRAKQSFYSDVNKFLHTWHVQSSSNTDLLQDNARCMSVNYKYNNINGMIHVFGKQYKEGHGWQILEASASPTDASRNEAKFTLSFTIPVYGEMRGAYTIVDTDYENYSVVHGCGRIFGLFYYECSWLMSRKQHLTADEKRAFYKQTSRVLKKYGSLGEFRKVDQTKC